ncbi:MAG: insulinase family protein [Anaerolineae bacterium]|nr:insulinase family protein [Anaerolineae bacterium]
MQNDHVQKTVLENGIRVLSERMEGTRSASIGVLVDVGSKDESDSERGYAHFLEHMLFQGTGERDAQAIAEMMEIGGGAIGAFTARDYTVYHATILDDYIPFALEVLGDMLGNSVLPEEALNRQRTVILNEIAGQVNPMRIANTSLKKALWPQNPLGFPTAGTRESIDQLTRETLLDFMHKTYSANRLVLAAAGNIDHQLFVEQARDSFWQIQRREPPTPPPSPSPTSNIVTATPRDLQQVYFAAAWPAPPYTDPDRYAWHLFTTLFGGGSNSRLYRRLREEMGMVYHIAAEYQAYGATGAMVVEGATGPQTLVPVLASMLIELARMAEDAVDPDAHHRAAQSMISQHLVSGDSAYVRMSRLALQELYFKQIVPSDAVIHELQHQSADSAQKIAMQLASGDLPTIALVGPIGEGLLQQVGMMLSDFGGTPTLAYSSNGRQPAAVQAASEQAIQDR